MLATDGWGVSWEITLRWIPLVLTDDKSTLVQVMAWCRQALPEPMLTQTSSVTSLQSVEGTKPLSTIIWPKSETPYGFTEPQWVKISMTPCFWSQYQLTVFMQEIAQHYQLTVFMQEIAQHYQLTVFMQEIAQYYQLTVFMQEIAEHYQLSLYAGDCSALSTYSLYAGDCSALST